MTAFYWVRAPVCFKCTFSNKTSSLPKHELFLHLPFSRATSKYSHRASIDCFSCRCTRAATIRSAAWEATATALITLHLAASTAAGGRSAAIEMPCAVLGTAAATVRP